MYKEIKSLIPNTICEAREVNGKVSDYLIRPSEGYKLHEITLDEPVFDEETGEETNKVKCGYTTGFTTVGANYDWSKNERKIYAIPIDAEDEIIDAEVVEDDAVKDSVVSEMAEKAKAYDILTGVEE